jgi:hypothetical protein
VIRSRGAQLVRTNSSTRAWHDCNGVEHTKPRCRRRRRCRHARRCVRERIVASNVCGSGPCFHWIVTSQHVALQPAIHIQSVHYYTYSDLLCHIVLHVLWISSDAVQVVDARSDASSIPTTRTFAQNALPAAAGASTKSMPTLKSSSITGRISVSGCQGWRLWSTHCSKTRQLSRRVAAKVTVQQTHHHREHQMSTQRTPSRPLRFPRRPRQTSSNCRATNARRLIEVITFPSSQCSKMQYVKSLPNMYTICLLLVAE